jgi:hypothetical protein
MSTIVKGAPHNVDVAKMQRSLNEIIYSNLREDGDFGDNTEKALQDWQLLHGYEPTGVYDGDTKRVLDTYIEKRFLKEQDFADAASELDCPVAHVKAVTKVESKGSGFLLSGRNVILFERHIFYSQLNKALKAEASLASDLAKKFNIKTDKLDQAGIIKAVQLYLLDKYDNIYNSKTGGYKGTVAGVEHEWERYKLADDIHPRCAAMSASYGLFQIMGFNYHLLVGYETVDDMIDAFNESEKNQLLGFCKFVKATPAMLKAIRTGDWLKFALLYNGPAQKGYDVKIAKAVKDFI